MNNSIRRCLFPAAGYGTRLLIIYFVLFTLLSSVCADAFVYGDVVEIAKKLSQKPYQEQPKVPDILLKLTYDQWRSIRFNAEKSLWRGKESQFEVQFFHTGFLYDRKVSVNAIEGGQVKPVPFSPGLFNYGVSGLGDKIPKDVGFAGFRIHYPIRTTKYYDEIIVFLGASYFRAVGSKDEFGVSTRGLAVNTAESSGEEFPYFKEFWIVRPAAKDESITVYALLDSPSVAGAYEFKIKPGKETAVNVTCTLFARNKVKFGIAPLTSMFFYGENINLRPADDYRPEVHDSDGIMISSSTGEWIWRPFVNPKKLLVTSFQLTDPKGFGFFQRDRNFDHYQDLESHYYKRPSVWVVPQNRWGKGWVELVEIPSENDINDNMVAYWVPESLPASLSYELRWGAVDAHLPAIGRAVATHVSAGKVKGTKLYLIDFDGGKLRALQENSKVTSDVSIGGADIVEQQIQKNTVTGGWRLVLHVRKKGGMLQQIVPNILPEKQPIEIRASLRLGNEVLTEIWSYVDFYE